MNLTHSTPPTYVVAASIVALVAAATPASAADYRVTASALNVRSGPSTNDGIVGRLTRGQTIDVTSMQSGWAAFAFKGTTRYVYAGYLERVAGAAPSGSATYETTTGLNLRSGPSTQDKILTTMPKGARVTSLGATNGWLRVRYGGTLGYAYGDYLRPVASETRSAPAPRPSTTSRPATRAHVADYRVKTPYSVARSAPSRTSSEVTTLRKGDRFRSTRSAVNGYYIGFTFQGRTAWVVKTSLEREESPNTLDTRAGKATRAELFRLKSDQDLRAGPTGSKKGVKLGRVRKGQLVTGQRYYDPRFFLLRSWRLISVDGRRGWVQARYLEGYEPVERPKPPTIDTRSGNATSGLYVLESTTTLREKPRGKQATVRLRKDSLVSARRTARVRFALVFKQTWILLARNGKTVGWVHDTSLRRVR